MWCTGGASCHDRRVATLPCPCHKYNRGWSLTPHLPLNKILTVLFFTISLDHFIDHFIFKPARLPDRKQFNFVVLTPTSITPRRVIRPPMVISKPFCLLARTTNGVTVYCLMNFTFKGWFGTHRDTFRP